MQLAENKNMRTILIKRWTVEENELLKRLIIASSTWDTILEAIPHRTKPNICAHIRVRLTL